MRITLYLRTSGGELHTSTTQEISDEELDLLIDLFESFGDLKYVKFTDFYGRAMYFNPVHIVAMWYEEAA